MLRDCIIRVVHADIFCLAIAYCDICQQWLDRIRFERLGGKGAVGGVDGVRVWAGKEKGREVKRRVV